MPPLVYVWREPCCQHGIKKRHSVLVLSGCQLVTMKKSNLIVGIDWAAHIDILSGIFVFNIDINRSTRRVRGTDDVGVGNKETGVRQVFLVTPARMLNAAFFYECLKHRGLDFEGAKSCFQNNIPVPRKKRRGMAQTLIDAPPRDKGKIRVLFNLCAVTIALDVVRGLPEWFYQKTSLAQHGRWSKRFSCLFSGDRRS